MSERVHFKAGLVIRLAFMVCLLALGSPNILYANAGEQDERINEGVYMGVIDLSDMTVGEAEKKVNEFVENLKQRVVTFETAGEHYVAVTVGDLGLVWTNPEDLKSASLLGKQGNIVKRYKVMQDLKHGNKKYPLELDIDKELLRGILEEQCAEYDIPAVDAKLVRLDDGSFSAVDGQTGESVNVEQSLIRTYDYLTGEWDYNDASIDLVIDVTEPKGTKEELMALTDVLGKFTTSYSTSSNARCKNIENATGLINGTLLYPGDEFSTLDTIVPFTEANGYFPAGSYLNGRVVESIGGGICQVSTTLYNAVLLAELEVTQRSNHSMIISYVEPSMDAAIAESAGKDFRFRNNLDSPVYIYSYTEGKTVTFEIYGSEKRDPSRKIRYESETLTVTHPDTDIITASSSMAAGTLNIQSAHVGYTAQLWKIVEQNGKEVSRDIVNKSTYKVSPRSATVGIASSNPAYTARMQAAIASGSIDTCKAEAAAINAQIQAEQQQQAALDAYYQALLQQQQQQQQQEP